MKPSLWEHKNTKICVVLLSIAKDEQRNVFVYIYCTYGDISNLITAEGDWFHANYDRYSAK